MTFCTLPCPNLIHTVLTIIVLVIMMLILTAGTSILESCDAYMHILKAMWQISSVCLEIQTVWDGRSGGFSVISWLWGNVYSHGPRGFAGSRSKSLQLPIFLSGGALPAIAISLSLDWFSICARSKLFFDLEHT